MILGIVMLIVGALLLVLSLIWPQRHQGERAQKIARVLGLGLCLIGVAEILN